MTVDHTADYLVSRVLADLSGAKGLSVAWWSLSAVERTALVATWRRIFAEEMHALLTYPPKEMP